MATLPNSSSASGARTDAFTNANQSDSVVSESAAQTAIEGIRDCDSKLKHLTAAITQLRKERTKHGDVLLRIMNDNQVRAIATRAGRITSLTTQPFKPLNKTDLTNILAEYAAMNSAINSSINTAQIKDMAEFIIDNRVRAKATHKIVQKPLLSKNIKT
jgi:hypothetical protein